MGGLLKRLPFETALFAIGLVCLMALPGSSGFFSKEAIIAQLWSSNTAGPLLWYCAIFGALLTSIYSCRLFFLAFMGDKRYEHELQPSSSKLLKLSLITLAALSLVGGIFAGTIDVSLSAIFPSAQTLNSNEPNWLHSVAIATPFIGIVFSWFYFSAYRSANRAVIQDKPSSFVMFCRQGLGFDLLYDLFLVKPYCYLAKLNHRDIFDQLIMLSAWYVGICHDVLKSSQTGKLRWYAAAVGLATLLLLLTLNIESFSQEVS